LPSYKEATMAVNAPGSEVKQAGRQAAGNTWFHRLSKVGLAARGLIYLLIGWLAIQIAFGDSGKEASRKGALETVAENPGGTFLLWMLVLGFLGLALWRFAEAIFGQPVADGKKAGKRLTSLARGVFYSCVFASVLAFVLGHDTGSSNEHSKTWTAKLMSEPGGRWLVLLGGLAFIAYGAYNIYKAVKKKFLEHLKTGEMNAHQRKVVTAVGVVGRSARGLVFSAAGVFLTYAAIKFDPDKAKGLDGTLREFADTPAGPWLLVAVALGLVTFGVYCFAEARWRKVEAVGSGRQR
jgi:uncharacterized protein DUF1206